MKGDIFWIESDQKKRIHPTIVVLYYAFNSTTQTKAYRSDEKHVTKYKRHKVEIEFLKGISKPIKSFIQYKTINQHTIYPYVYLTKILPQEMVPYI